MEKTPPKARRRRSKPPREADPIQGLFGVAMLKIAVELKKSGSAPIDEVVDSVLSRMSIEPAEFRKYLASQGGVLQRLEQIRRGPRP